MINKKLTIIFFILSIVFTVKAQKKEIIIADYENKPNTANWWKLNSNVKFSLDEKAADQVNKNSKVCLYVRWDSTQKSQPFTWFTDLKADTFAVSGMEEKWKDFKDKTWMSFWCKAGSGILSCLITWY